MILRWFFSWGPGSTVEIDYGHIIYISIETTTIKIMPVLTRIEIMPVLTRINLKS